MNSALKRRLLRAAEGIARLAVAVMLLLAAGPKLLDPTSFAKAITNYKLVLPVIGQDYIYPVAILMPALELVTALALLVPRWKKAGALLGGSLMLLFSVLIAQALVRGLNIDCGCFGAGAVGHALAQKVGWEKIVENAALLGGCVLVYFRAESLPAGKRYALAEKARVWK